MNYRKYETMFQGEPDVLTVPDVIRLLRIGKNSVYKLLKDGTISSIKQGKKIIVPKVCLVEFLADEKTIRLFLRSCPKRAGLLEKFVIVLWLPEKPKERRYRKERCLKPMLAKKICVRFFKLHLCLEAQSASFS